jgi:hypothetical protein
MKKLMMMALMMCFTSLSFGQTKNDSDLRSDINKINLKLDKFGTQHRTGNHLIIAGTLFNLFGVLVMNHNITGQSNQNNQILGNNILVVGSLITTTGLVFNIDSFRHLR